MAVPALTQLLLPWQTTPPSARITRMRLDTMVRLIEAADPSSFRELALLYLAMSDYTAVELRDGVGDAGNDVSLWRVGPNPEPVAVQLSVQRSGWQSKVRQDAQRAKDLLGYQQFVYVTSRRVAATVATPLIEELWSRQAVSLRIIDSQALASKFHIEGRSRDLIRTLGLADAAGGYEQGTTKNLRADLAYAYAFFGTDVSTFRQTGLQRSIVACIVGSKDPVARGAVTSAVAKALRLGKGRERLVAVEIDRMLQKRDVRINDGVLVAAPHLVDAHKASRTIRNYQWQQLRKAVESRLGASGLTGRRLEKASAAVNNAAGALMMNAASVAAKAMEYAGDVGPAKTQVRRQLQRVERALITEGIEPGKAPTLVAELAEQIATSELGQTLLAGDLFLSLLAMDSTAFLNALGGHEELEVFLDASVAIPMLASLLYEPHDEHFFRAAHFVYEQAATNGFRLSLPLDYLEEAASHLLDAFDRYQPLLDDPDLRFSKNAFVAHYLALKYEHKYDGSFMTYVQSFGLRASDGKTRDFAAERNWIMGRMRTLFGRYGISVAEPGQVARQALGAAQEAIAYTARELGLDRSGLLLAHDARAVADISARAAAGQHAVIFCTWDRLHLRLRTAGGAVEWNALTPAMLADLFALLGSSEDELVVGATDIALEFGDAEARRGAEIWDELVRIEQAPFYDAELLRQAQAFKSSYVDSQRLAELREPLATAWTNWKAA